MLHFFAPDLHLENVLELTHEVLKQRNLEGLLLDLDCTLKDYHAEELSPTVLAWLKVLQDAGIGLCLLSNGKPHRIGAFAETLKIPFVAKAFKPLPYGCHQGLKKLKLHSSRVAVVGDQVFADILAGRLAGLFTILVQPTSPVEPWFTRLKRPVERHYLRWWKARCEYLARRKPVGLSPAKPNGLQTLPTLTKSPSV